MAKLTDYDALLCDECADVHPPYTITPVDGSLIADVYGYDSGRCEDCGVTLYDGLLGVSR